MKKKQTSRERFKSSNVTTSIRILQRKQTKNYLNRINQLGISDEQLKELLEQRIQGRILTEQQ